MGCKVAALENVKALKVNQVSSSAKELRRITPREENVADDTLEISACQRKKFHKKVLYWTSNSRYSRRKLWLVVHYAAARPRRLMCFNVDPTLTVKTNGNVP